MFSLQLYVICNAFYVKRFVQFICWQEIFLNEFKKMFAYCFYCYVEWERPVTDSFSIWFGFFVY